MYTEVLSPSFVGMTFNQASVLCFSKLRLLMLAIETKSDVGESFLTNLASTLPESTLIINKLMLVTLEAHKKGQSVNV